MFVCLGDRNKISSNAFLLYNNLYIFGILLNSDEAAKCVNDYRCQSVVNI